MPEKNPLHGEHAPDLLDDLFDKGEPAEPIEQPEWHQGGQDFGDRTPRVSRNRNWYEHTPGVVGGRDPADPMDNDWDMMGLQVPGLFKAQRDQAIKDSALRLLDDGFRKLFREVYNLSRDVPKANRLRAGFEQLGPKLKEAYQRYFKWYQALAARDNGTLEKVWADQLAGFRREYDDLRAGVDNLLAAQGKRTSSMPGANLYDPPKQGESWADWLSRFPTGAGIGFGLIIAAVALWWATKK